MTLPSSGPLAASDINIELGRAGTARFNIGGPQERALAKVPSGPIAFSDFYGKSWLFITTMVSGFNNVFGNVYGYRNFQGDPSLNVGSLAETEISGLPGSFWATLSLSEPQFVDNFIEVRIYSPAGTSYAQDTIKSITFESPDAPGGPVVLLTADATSFTAKTQEDSGGILPGMWSHGWYFDPIPSTSIQNYPTPYTVTVELG